jgi:aspartate racemase
MIGVIGGMGPLATADFVQKVIAATPAEHDQEHVPMIISNDPRIPRRPAAILEQAASPLPRLIDIRDRLIQAGATALVMPCNTAHFWYDELISGCTLPFPSIIEVTSQAAAKRTHENDRVGLVATRATLATGLLQNALRRSHRETILPSEQVTQQLMLPAIADVKSGNIDRASEIMHQTVVHLLQQGAKTVILACTEAPVAMSRFSEFTNEHCIDSTQALAERTVNLWAQLNTASVVGDDR